MREYVQVLDTHTGHSGESASSHNSNETSEDTSDQADNTSKDGDSSLKNKAKLQKMDTVHRIRQAPSTGRHKKIDEVILVGEGMLS